MGIVIFLPPPPGFDSKVLGVGCIFSWRRGCGFHLEQVEEKQWFHLVSVWYLVVERSSVTLLRTDFAAFVNAAFFI